MHMENKKMRAADYEGTFLRGATEHEEAATAASTPDRLFSTGQSVLHWWSSWFATAKTPKMQLKGKERPAWFDATIVLALEPKAVMYAGTMWPEGPVYQVH